MEDTDRLTLETITLAPYIQKATALIGLGRRIGGNQFRHAMSTMAILIDYGYIEPVLLKAAVIHDLFEDFPKADPDEIRRIDRDGELVVGLVYEVTRRNEPKAEFMARIRDHGTQLAKILKVADRISNLTDLQLGVFTPHKIESYLDETEKFVVPMANEVNQNMAVEVDDLIRRRREILSLGQ
jgi:GTP pyrophosphokinase